MTRKKWTPKEEVTPELLVSREKRKWQIALRRYVLEGNPSTRYAPYFGLDINTLRNWFELQFVEPMSWENFGTKWQFEHHIPVSYFDFSKDEELKLCWNFLNLRAELVDSTSGGQNHTFIKARTFFQGIADLTGNKISRELLQKIQKIESGQQGDFQKQADFLNQRAKEFKSLEHYGEFEFGLLNKGHTIEEVNKELEALKKIRF